MRGWARCRRRTLTLTLTPNLTPTTLTLTLTQVAMTDLLKRSPQRTWRPSEARLYFVPVWEFTSFTIGQCNGAPPHRPRTPD